jgi:hypothetical protein
MTSNIFDILVQSMIALKSEEIMCFAKAPLLDVQTVGHVPNNLYTRLKVANFLNPHMGDRTALNLSVTHRNVILRFTF